MIGWRRRGPNGRAEEPAHRAKLRERAKVILAGAFAVVSVVALIIGVIVDTSTVFGGDYTSTPITAPTTVSSSQAAPSTFRLAPGEGIRRITGSRREELTIATGFEMRTSEGNVLIGVLGGGTSPGDAQIYIELVTAASCKADIQVGFHRGR